MLMVAPLVHRRCARPFFVFLVVVMAEWRNKNVSPNNEPIVSLLMRVHIQTTSLVDAGYV
jgi:hypothetical protein